MTHDGPYKISLFSLTRFLRHVDAKEVPLSANTDNNDSKNGVHRSP